MDGSGQGRPGQATPGPRQKPAQCQLVRSPHGFLQPAPASRVENEASRSSSQTSRSVSLRAVLTRNYLGKGNSGECVSSLAKRTQHKPTRSQTSLVSGWGKKQLRGSEMTSPSGHSI